METRATDDQRLVEQEKNVREYLEWIEQTDAELRLTVHEECLRLKNVNRRVVDTPVY